LQLNTKHVKLEDGSRFSPLKDYNKIGFYIYYRLIVVVMMTSQKKDKMNHPLDETRELLPSGTVTFLFTDIENSTLLAKSFPSQMPALIERHHAILHASIQNQRGYVFQIVGDGFCAAFHTALDALSAVQRSGCLYETGSSHHGPYGDSPAGCKTVIRRLPGAAVIDGACKSSRAHGGQVLLSSAAPSWCVVSCDGVISHMVNAAQRGNESGHCGRYLPAVCALIFHRSCRSHHSQQLSVTTYR
jgi:hypothetical protein